jgi:hypothetical protein
MRANAVLAISDILKEIRENPKQWAIYAAIAVGGVVALVIVGKVLYWLKRQWDLRRIASALGLDYCWFDRWQTKDKCAFLPLFSRSSGGRISAMAHGSKDGVDIKIFDFRRRPDRGVSKVFRWWTTVVLLEMSYEFPFFYLRKEKFTDKLAALIGHNDIDDFSNSEFNRKFYVKSADKQFAHDLMTDEMIEFVMKRAGDEPINIEMSRKVMAFHLDRISGVKKAVWLHGFAMEFWDKTPEKAVSRAR